MTSSVCGAIATPKSIYSTNMASIYNKKLSEKGNVFLKGREAITAIFRTTAREHVGRKIDLRPKHAI